jgi:hypothetical protein
MVSEDQFKDCFAYVKKTLVVRYDFYPFPNIVGAGGDKLAPAVRFHYTDAAPCPLA